MKQRRKISDEREARRSLAAAAAAGGTIRQWAHANGIDGRSLNAWRMNLKQRNRKALPKRRAATPPASPQRQSASRRSRSGSPKVSPGPLLVELVPATAPPTPERRYVVQLGDLRVEVSDDFDPQTLRRLLEVLRAC